MEKLQYLLRCPLLTVLCNNKSFLTQNTLLFFIHLRGKRARRTGTCLECTAHNPIPRLCCTAAWIFVKALAFKATLSVNAHVIFRLIVLIYNTLCCRLQNLFTCFSGHNHREFGMGCKTLFPTCNNILKLDFEEIVEWISLLQDCLNSTWLMKWSQRLYSGKK